MPASRRIVCSTEPEDEAPVDFADTFLAETVPEETGVEELLLLFVVPAETEVLVKVRSPAHPSCTVSSCRTETEVSSIFE